MTFHPFLKHSSSARTRVRSARVTLGYGVIVLLFTMLGIAIALETVRPQWRDPEFGHRVAGLHEIHQENPTRSHVLVLGTSRTQNAINPTAMGFLDAAGTVRVFNFGQSGASPLKILLTLTRILGEGIRPEAVIVEVLPTWLTWEGPAEDQFRTEIQRLSLDDLQHLAPYCDHLDDLRGQWFAARSSPWHAQRISLMSHWLPQWMPWQSRINFQWQSMTLDGFVPYLYIVPPPEFRLEATEKTRQQHAGLFQGFRPSSMSLRAMRDLAARCRSEHIPVAFFIPPVAPIFRGWFEPQAWQTGESDLKAFCQELGIELFPAPNEFTDADFADGHHMLRTSAELYSQWLADKHLRSWCLACSRR